MPNEFLSAIKICYYDDIKKTFRWWNFVEVDNDALQATYKKLADLLGDDLMMKFYQEFRGTQLSLPMKLYDREGAAKAVRQHYPEMTVKELADTYGYTQRWVKQELKQAKTD